MLVIFLSSSPDLNQTNKMVVWIR